MSRMKRRDFLKSAGLATGAGMIARDASLLASTLAPGRTLPAAGKEYGLLECADPRISAAFARSRAGILACTVNDQTHCCDAGRRWGTGDVLNDLYFGLHGGLFIGDEYQHRVFRNELRKIAQHIELSPHHPPVPWSVSADGRTPYFNPDPGYDLDRNAEFVLQVVRTYEVTGDREFALDLYPKCALIVDYLAARDLDGDLLPEGRTTWFDDPSGRGGGCASLTYIGDTVGNTWKDFGAALFYYEALRRLALLENLLGKKTAAARHLAHARGVRDAARRILWNARTDGFLAWIDKGGTPHDEWITGNNLHAVFCGMAGREQSERIMRKLEANRAVLEDLIPCRVRLGIYPPRLCSNRPNYYWNGGIWTLVSAPDMLARAGRNDLAGALHVAEMLSTHPKVTEYGFYEAYDGKTGEPNDCRGLLMNNGGFVWGFLGGVLGIDIHGDELRFRSTVPAPIIPAKARILYRGADFEIHWQKGKAPSARLDNRKLELGAGGYCRVPLTPEPQRTYAVEIVSS